MLRIVEHPATNSLKSLFKGVGVDGESLLLFSGLIVGLFHRSYSFSSGLAV